MHCNNGLNNKLVESLVENKVAQETGDLKYLQDSMYDFVNTLKEIILGEYSPEFFNKYVDEALKLHGSNLDEFLKIPKMGLELRQALNSIDEAIDTSNQEFKDNLVLLLDRFQTTLDNIVFEARDAYETALDNGFKGTKQEWLEHLEGDSAYKIATLNGFKGTEKEWLDHLEGDSAYEIAVKNGYKGTQAEWLKYIRADGFIQSIQQFATNDAETKVQIPDYGTINSLQGYIKELFENGGIADRFKTVEQMQTEGAELPEGSYALVADDTDDKNGIYIKESGAWVKTKYNTYDIAKKVVDLVVSSELNELFAISYNLFDPNAATKGYSTSAEDGSPTPLSGYYLSDYIKVEPNSKYTLTATSGVEAFRNIALYRADKSFVKRVLLSSYNWNTPYVLNTDKETYFIRVSTRSGTAFDYERMIYKGDDIKPYMPYFKSYPKSVVLTNSLKSEVELVAKSVASSLDSRFFLSSSNLFNYKYIKVNHVIDSSTGEVRPATDDLSGWCCTTEFVSVEPDSYLTYYSPTSNSNIRYTAWYDKDKRFIFRGNTLTSSLEENLYKKVPENAYYVRFALQLNDFDGSDPKKAVYAGKIPIDDLYYVSGKPVLSNIRLGDDVLEGISVGLDPSVDSKIILSRPANGVYNSTPTWDSYTDWKSKTAGEVYAMYDALATQHPTYIKRVELGEDDFGNAMYYYEFASVTPSTDNPTSKPAYDKHKLNLVCGMHGNEKLPTLATYLMLEQICNNWQSDPMLEVLRFNLDMVVLPIANPSGWNANERKNGNGVDLNRNFPQGFYKSSTYNSPDSPKHGGGEPLNQKETQYIATMLNDHKNAQIAIDYHNHFGNANKAFMWASVASGEQTRQVAKALVTRVHSKWVKEFDWINKDEAWLSGYVTTRAGDAVLQGFMRDNGAKYAMTFEVCETWLDVSSVKRFDATMCKTATEAITNMILVALNELDKE